MVYNSMPAGAPREISGCSPNRHENARHPDRVMAEHDLIYIRSGEWEICQEQERFRVRAGDLVLLFAGRHHYGEKPCGGAVETFFIHFLPMEGDQICPSPPSAEGGARYAFPAVVHTAPGSMAAALMERAVSAYWQNDPYARVRASMLLELVLCEMSSIAAGPELRADGGELIERLMFAMRSSPERFYSNDELAARIGVSRKTLSNAFRRFAGTSPHAWQLATKLDAAAADIRADPRVTLRALAERYGFCDEYHFSRLYKARFGHPPKSR